MKRFIFLVSVISILLVSSSAFAQSYSAAAGVRLGPSYGLTGKFFVSDNAAAEFIVGSRWNGGQIVALYEIHNNISKSRTGTSHGFDSRGLRWYFGIGGHVGSYNASYAPNYWGWNKTNRSYTVIGVDGILGLEYTFVQAPINISIDYKPAFNFIGWTGLWPDQGGLSVRYAF